MAAEKPNIIVIMVDDMGYGGVSCFDNKHFKTPQIDRLAAEGMKFTDFHSNGVSCTPTRAAFMTGRYQQRSGCWTVINADPAHEMHKYGIHESEWTFAEAMKQAGYKTGIFGKWHLGYKKEFNPTLHGFDEFKGFVSGNIDAHSHYDRMETFDWWEGTELKDQEGYHTDVITKNSLDFIERHQNEPFFLYIPHGAPHTPIMARNSKIKRGPNKGNYPSWAKKMAYNSRSGSDSWIIKHFISPVDEGVGQILDKLVELKLDKNTIVWFFSDNGAAKANKTSSPLTRAGKASPFEGGHRVPAAVWAPGRINSGSSSNELVMSFDLMPSALKLAGISIPKEHKFDGIDINPVLFKQESLAPRTMFWGITEKSGALRDNNLKLVIHKDKNLLFDLKNDPQETVDLAPQQPERVQHMRAQWEMLMKSTSEDSPFN